MAHSTEFENIRDDILAKLKKTRQQFPERFSIPIHVLPAVDGNENDEWEQRLRQAKEDQTGERVTLIPYKVKGRHWIGVLLKFKANKQIERAEFFDSVKHSNFVPDKLQKKFTKIYSGVILQSRNLQKHDNPKQSAALTVDNLLKATEEAQLSDISTDPKPNIGFTENEPPNNPTPISSEGKESKLRDLELRLISQQKELGISDLSKLSEEIQHTEQQIKIYEKADKKEELNREKNVWTKLLKLQSLVEEIKLIKSPEESMKPAGLKKEEEEYPITTESVRNMHDDLYSMPPCLERSITCLLYYLSLKSIDNSILSNYNIKVPDQIDTEIGKEFECLKERLRIEEFESTEIDYSVSAASIKIKNKNWKCAITALRQLLKRIQPLDMHELFRLVEKVDDAAVLVKNKEIILFMGRTGSGKSTTIHFLSGSKMVQVEEDGYDHIAPTEIKNPDLEKITSSPKARSETRYITPVTVNYSDVGAYSYGSVILCDSPGFGDSGGPAVDIANGIGIIKAITACKSVKPVLLLSYKCIGDRCEGIKELAHLLAGLIPDIGDQIRAFSYIFTKYPDKEKKTIHTSLNDVNKTLTEAEKSDTGFTNVLKDMLKKTRSGARVLNPLEDDPGQILDEFADSAVIDHPDEVFQFSITAESKAVLQQQITQNKSSITSATKRSEYSFVKYKLDQLKCLNDLLHEDYIEQIYNECVRHINKHLSDEYENGISILDRCLINQTIINIEDIQQYQTCIDHFKLVDELRSIHLGQEVVHSSAFILHLNQQIDNLCVDLREKDIDDSSVKVSLDKIKIVSDFFPNVNCTYKYICQLFSEKFDLTINSFKNSVLSNKFNDSANNITKVNNARMILHDHLDHEHMQVKYVELQKYFLNYLYDAVKNLDNILTKDKLEKTDIGSFNNCVCMLESATNTFALEPHISMKDIGIIYENLLSQILNYVDEIIKKIDTQFKNENSFHILEQYMKQLDLIRTIPIVSLKTSESYWKTLEKLVGYIQESKRLAEEQLRILCRREGKVDYKKLMKSLLSLKGAEWIEKYRNGVYSDVINDVEQQLIEHIETLKESFMEVDLSLDNFNKIKQVHDIILEINEMKPIEKIVCGVSEHINAVNSWFTKVTNDVFIIIKDTFKIENWKEQGYPTVDFNKAEKAFSYLDICRNLKILIRSNCMSVLNGLEGFIRYYCDTVQKEMENHFDFITQFQNQNKKELFKKARILANRLRELIEIKTCNRVYSCFSNKRIAEYWQKDLSNYLIELADEMERAKVIQQIEILSEKLLVAKALSGLDEFLQTDKYNTLYTKYQSVFFSETNEISKRVIDAIKTHDYEQVSLDMATLQSSSEIGQKYFELARRALIVGLENLIEETKTQAIWLGNNIGKEQIQPIVENLKRLQKAKQFVSTFFQPEEIYQCIDEVKQLIEERIKRFLEGVKALITINNFYEADKKVDSITLVRSILGNYCTPDIWKQIDELKERQNKVVLEDVVTKYSEMDLSSYTLNPPTDIFAKFLEVNSNNPVYHQALIIIKERILDKFRKELEQAKSRLPPNPENVHIRRFESAVKHLPDEMRNTLEVELKHCKDDIALLIRDNNTKLEDALKSGDLNNIGNVFEEYQKSEGMQCYVNRVRDDVLKQMQELALIITQNFAKHEIAKALNNIKKLYDYKIKLEKLVDGTK
jgi:flagellar biosynthesis GTPase FlhF